MAFTSFTYDMDIIARLSDSPNVDDGLTAAQLKAKFDEGGKAIKNYINSVLLEEALERPTFSGLVKSSGGGVSAAEAGVDYQAPLKAGTDYQTPLKAGEDYSVPSAAKTATLAADGWADGQQTVSVPGVTESGNIIVTPAPDSYVAYGESVVRCVAQAEGSLTFQCEDVPAEGLTVSILIVG